MLMMKILHFSAIYAPAWKWGGPPRSVANLAEGQAANGHDVTVLTTDAGLEDDRTLARGVPVIRNGVRVTYFPARRTLFGVDSPALKAEVAACAGKFDIIHISGVWQPMGPMVGKSARCAGVPYVVSPRGMLGPYSFSQRPVRKHLFWWLVDKPHLRRAAALHATSGMEVDELASLLPGKAIFNAPNAIDTGAWRRDTAAGEAWRTRNSISSGIPVLLAAGRLHHKKGLEFLADVFALLPTTQDWRMVFAGPDEDGTQARLDEVFSRIGHRSRVIFTGQCDTVALKALYSAADALLFPSLHENFGNVAVEALACGCPVVLSAGVGAAQALTALPGVTVADRDPEAWRQAVEEVIVKKSDWGAKRPLLANAVEAKFGTRSLALTVCDEYTRLLSGKHSKKSSV
jgi:glycosyltransferase involved in cell wall biosynthesis